MIATKLTRGRSFSLRQRNRKGVRFLQVFILTGLLHLCGPSLIANITVYSGSDPGANSFDPRPNSNAAAASFDAAAGAPGSLTILTIENVPVGYFSTLNLGSGATLTGLDGSNSNQEIRNTPFSNPDSWYGYNTTIGGSQFIGMNGGYITLTFSSPTNSFGAYFSRVQDFNPLSLIFNDGSKQSVSVPNLPGPNNGGGIEFVGFTDTTGLFSSVTFQAPGDYVAVDDVRFVSAPIPEASTFPLFLCAGVILLICGRLRRPSLGGSAPRSRG